MLILLRISISLLTYLYFFRESFIAELAISFIPYIIWFCILTVFIEIYLIIHESKRRRKHKSIKIFFIILITIITIWIWTLYSSEYFWFYNQNDEKVRLENKDWISVFYANILYKNTDYKSLQQKIEEKNPDIVVLVEFSNDHEYEMKDFFKKSYPYMNRNSWSSMLAWDVVFSKIPLKNITETHMVKAWERNYSYMKILCDKCKDWIDFYVIHTAAPASLTNFYMRNSQLSKFKSDFTKEQNLWTPTIIIWDFNVSPRSYYYKQLTKNRNMQNILRFQSPNYTWSLLQQWIFRSHIDQLFISPEIQISKIKIEDLTGSDHRSFSFNFWIKAINY